MVKCEWCSGKFSGVMIRKLEGNKKAFLHQHKWNLCPVCGKKLNQVVEKDLCKARQTSFLGKEA